MKTIMSKAIAFGFLAFWLGGCADPVVGKWESKDDRSVDLAVESADSGYRGDGHIYLCDDSQCFLCPFDFDASSRGDDRFEIDGNFTGNCSSAGAFTGVECEVYQDELTCDIPGGTTIKYEKVD